MSLTCSTIGEISVSVDSCVFTPDNAVYEQDYKVFTIKDETDMDGDSSCFRTIETADDILTWNWNYAQAADCGWKWSTADGKITFS